MNVLCKCRPVAAHPLRARDSITSPSHGRPKLALAGLQWRSSYIFHANRDGRSENLRFSLVRVSCAALCEIETFSLFFRWRWRSSIYPSQCAHCLGVRYCRRATAFRSLPWRRQWRTLSFFKALVPSDKIALLHALRTILSLREG